MATNNKETERPMEVHQLVLKGYDGSTDETDHLIKWVAVPEGGKCFQKN